MQLDNHSRTEKRNRGHDTREGHKGKTLAGAILAMPKMYHKALEVIDASLSKGDFNAAKFVVEQVDGKAPQKIDLNGSMTLKQPPTTMTVRIAKD